MNNLRDIVSQVFQSPMYDLSFVAYLSNIDSAGKMTQKSLINLMTVLFTYAEEQEKINEQHEANFKEIEAILAKLVDKKVDHVEPQMTTPTDNTDLLDGGFTCPTCGKILSTKLALAGHTRSHKK